jgi:hypothetical protein
MQTLASNISFVRRLTMPPLPFRLPAHCANCGTLFLSSYALGPSLGTTFRNNFDGCPNCGMMAKTIDGKFDFVDNVLKIVDAPPRTIEILRILQAALDDAQRGKPAEEVIADIEKKSPVLGSALGAAIRKWGSVALSGILLSLAASCSMNTSLDWNQLADQVHVYTTGAEPYPGLGSGDAPKSEKISRQQRRHHERQAEKAKRKVKTEVRSTKKPRKR